MANYAKLVVRLLLGAMLIGAVLGAIVACGSDASIDTVKNGTTEFDKSTTIGKAFDNYDGFSDVSWTTRTQKNGVVVVIATCTIKFKHPEPNGPKGYFIVEWKLNADDPTKFSINAAGFAYHGSDGKVETSDLPDMDSVVLIFNKIYQNELTPVLDPTYLN
jgi:hypothetical protein